MEYSYYRAPKSHRHPKVVPIFALGHHKPMDEGKDEFTKTVINFYKYGNRKEMEYLMQRTLELFEKRFRGDLQYDLICIIPTHTEKVLNPNMVKFAQEFAGKVGIKFDQVLERTMTVKGQHEQESIEARKENVKDSLAIKGDVKGKNILVFDNYSISGSNCIDAFDTLISAGAANIVFICFGVGFKGKEGDFDLNPNMGKKVSEIIEMFHWPKLSKEKRAEFKAK